MKPYIVVVGSANVDYLMSMERLPRRGETVTDAEFTQAFGGKGANQAVAVARAAGECRFISAVGDDPNADGMVSSWAKAGVDVSSVFRCSGISSGAALIMIDENGENYLSIAPGSNYRLTVEAVEKHAALLAGARFILLQYEIPVETISWIIDFAQSHTVETIWNFAPARPFPGEYEGRVDYLIVNETEAGFLANEEVVGTPAAARCARMLLERGARQVVVTLGSAGCVVADSESVVTMPSFAVQAVDTTAAGDVFCGALSVALLEGRSFHEAARFASAASAICVTQLGAQPSAPSREAIDAFLAERGDELQPQIIGAGA